MSTQTQTFEVKFGNLVKTVQRCLEEGSRYDCGRTHTSRILLLRWLRPSRQRYTIYIHNTRIEIYVTPIRNCAVWNLDDSSRSLSVKSDTQKPIQQVLFGKCRFLSCKRTLLLHSGTPCER